MATMEQVDGYFVDRAEHLARTSRVIAAPPQAVWHAIVENPAGWTDWFPRCRSCFYPSGNGEVGTVRSVALGPLKAEEIVVTCEPQQRWGFSIVEANMPGVLRLYEQVEFVPTSTAAGDATRVSYTGAFDVARWARPTAGVSAATFKKVWAAAFAALDAQLSSAAR